ncbi:MAG: acetyl/propionyl/methylcrotonyl-CoA carboxylase subunit alpha [Desulfuromonadales bacterium]|nr:acetyl/propionyl/methylcrotonyl-CoA carboxylase subunit alpha [Desulfuromonadales bacterium]
MFDKILIANRGEIACRIIKSARSLGIQTVVVYSDADASSRHVDMADEAYHIGPSPADESYLIPERLLTVAKESGAQAVHPGYGFLSENAGFAASCMEAGISFIGPPVAAIEAMGNKSAAKRIMEKAAVPLVPGYHGDEQEPAFLHKQADAIGYPLLIKATAGGGGKGMRVVENSDEFIPALAGACREGKSSFGDDRVLLERYLTKPRHVEIQVFADSQGAYVHLFERDCSIQRRHQKVVEEAPAPGMTPELREKMGSAAIAAAQAIGYVGAGTVEFLLDEDGSFYFMEMNTRLQVEHPVTEMITGQDLVEWQLRVAAGEKLPATQQELYISGHAIEVRIYAEDADRDFLPSTGMLTHLSTPDEGPHVRIDTGVRQGDTVSIHYDPMIAKLIVWDQDRASALRRLRTALSSYQVAGVTTNIGFLGSVAAQSDFAAANFDTGFIERHRQELFPESRPASDRTLALACLDVLLRRAEEARVAAATSFDPHSPWHQTGGWRLNCDNHQVLVFEDGEEEISVTAHYRQKGYLLDLPSGAMLVNGELAGDLGGDDEIMADLDGKRFKATVVRNGAELSILCQGTSHRLKLQDPYARLDQEANGGRLTAPMPGMIIAFMADVGSDVKEGTPLVILEAMKMEHTITAPADGKVIAFNYDVGAMVEDGAELIDFEVAEVV